MDPNIHPDLHQLHQRYLQLVQAVNDQTMPIEDAVTSLEAMRVIDGSGAEWSYTTAGQLVRAEGPGAEPVPSEPWAFVAPQLPPRPDQNQWQAPFPTQAPQPTEAGTPAGWGSPQGGQPGYPPASGGPQQSGRPLPGSGGTSGKGIPALQPIIGILKENGKTIVVAIVVAVLVFVVTGRSGDPEPDPVDSIPVAPAPQLPQMPTPTTPEAPTTPEPEPEPEPETPAEEPLVPTGDEVVAVIEAVRSGDMDLIAAASQNYGEETDMRILAAQLAGLEAVGLGLTADPAAPGEDGQALQNWLLVDILTGETLRTYPVVWERTEAGQWLLVEIPDLR